MIDDYELRPMTALDALDLIVRTKRLHVLRLAILATFALVVRGIYLLLPVWIILAVLWALGRL